ncbi:MAG: CDP-archaeol synthase [Candidatus Competibacteraceae bacterium]
MAFVELQLLLLILIANGVPIIAAAVCGDRGARPVDGGRRWIDGRRLLGDAKTWRGVALAPLAAALGATLLGWSAMVGLTIGAAAMLGDLLSSFVKRRLGVPTSGMALGLDQIPEALLPLLAVADVFGLSWPAIAATTAGFIVLELALSRVLYRLGIRNRPY